jgi:hypothetical protein
MIPTFSSKNRISFCLPMLILYFPVIAFCSGIKTLSGDISNVIFDTLQKIYHAEASLIIPEGSNVTIPGGIVILFNSGTSFSIKGRCTVSGSEQTPVVLSSINDPVFNPSSSSAAPFDWNGLNIFNSATEVILQYVTIKYAKYPLVSKAPSLQLIGVQRSQTASTDFIINQDTLSVVADKNFDFPPPLPPNEPVAITPPVLSVPEQPQQEKPELVSEPPLIKDLPWWKKRFFRGTLLGTGGAAVLTSAGCLIGYYVEESEIDRQLSILNDPTIPPDQWDKRRNAENIINNSRNNQQYFKQGGIISLITGALLLAGFGLTFYF